MVCGGVRCSYCNMPRSRSDKDCRHLAKNNPNDRERGILPLDREHLNDTGNRLVAEATHASRPVDPNDPDPNDEMPSLLPP